MTAPLDSARYMLANAIRHTTEFKGQVDAFIDSQPYIQVIEVDADTGERVGKWKLAKPMPHWLDAIAADAVANFRAALDQIGYAVSIAGGGRGKNTYFPFGDTADQVRSRKNGGAREIPVEIFAVMEAFQPYLGGNHPLWALNKLCNVNKHRILCPAGFSPTAVRFNRLSGSGAWGSKFPKWNDAKNEMELFRVSPGGRLDCDINFIFTIGFSDIDILRGIGADGVLDTFAREVQRVLEAVEAEANRTGLFK